MGHETLLQLKAFALPAFILLIFIEYWVAKGKGKSYFNYNNSIVNLSVGIAERALDLFTIGGFYTVFTYIKNHYALFEIPNNVYTNLILFLLIDFVWYWYHRFGHEINIFWSAHIVHHQSEDFNYTVSARITLFQSVIRNMFWCILPFIGFSPETIAVLLLIHGVYPFFLHTRTIGKLGWLEYIFVTPSHHRVHHGSNPIYLDKNYGDVFIVWDKIFGTFQEEKEEPVYGLTKPLNTHSFLWQHFHQVLEVLYEAKKAKGLQRKLKILFGKPEIINPDLREKLEQKFLPPKNEDNHKKLSILNYYIIGQLVLSLCLLMFLTLMVNSISSYVQLFLVAIILITLINICAILEQRKWIFYLEYSRLIIVMGILLHIYLVPLLVVFTISLITLVTIYFEKAEKIFLEILYENKVQGRLKGMRKM